MATSVSNFLERFHNFKGITIGERKKELFLLLREYGSVLQSPVEIELLLEQLKPKTYFEQKMFIDILISLKCERELLKLFRVGDEKLMKKLWKQFWFFEKLLTNSIEWIVDEVFPELSYVTRIRFLKNIIYYTKDEKKVEQLFDMVLNKYGITNAQYVLAGCSYMKILETIAYGHIGKFSNQQLIFLLKNKKGYLPMLMKSDSRLIDFYDEHSKAFKAIAGSDHNIFIKIFRDNGCSRLGKRLTRKILKKEMPFVMKEASEIHEKLHQRTLQKNLGSNFEPFFFSTWPSSFSSFRPYACFTFMKFCLREKYVEIMQKGLRQLYNTSLSEHPDLIKDELLEKTGNIDVRESLLELRMQDSKEEYTLPQYYRIDKSIPILKKKISGADGVRTRENLVVALVKTCKINNDVNALLKVQEYFNFRHKNDDQSIRSSFLSEIKNCFDLSSLTEAHWNLIFDHLKWSKVKNQYFWGTGEIYMLHVKFLYKNNAELDVISKQFFDNYLVEILKCFSSAWKILDDVPKLQKYLLEKLMYSSLPPNYKEDEKSDLYFEFFEAVLSWNKKYPNDTIDYLKCSGIRETVKTKLKSCDSYSIHMEYLKNYLKRKTPCDDEFLKELEQSFWDNLSNTFDVNIIEYYLRKNPLKLIEYFDKFINSMEKQYSRDSLTIWRLVKHYDHLSIVQKIVEHSVSPNKFEISLGIGLATILKPEDYIKFLSQFKTEMLDVDNEEQVENHRLAMRLLEYAKFNDSFTILPYIVQYCEGDSLREALPPLYYYFQHSPEKYLNVHLQILSDRAVSVRKHAIKLACSVSPTEVVYNLIKTMTESEKNQSVLEHAYWKTFKYFLVNKSERFFDLLKIQLKSLDILESNAFKESCSIREIPKQFRLPYFDFLWQLLGEHEEQGENVSEFKETIIESLTSEMFKELPCEFCCNFIKQEFLKFGSKNERIARSFTLNCLKFCNEKELILSVIHDVIIEFKKNYILHPDFKISCKGRSCIDDFVSSMFYQHSDFELSTLQAFFINWGHIFTAVEDVKNYIRLTMLLQLKNINNLDDYVLKVAEVYKQLLNDFGVLGVMNCFKDDLCSLLRDDIFGSSDYDEKKYKLALKLIELNDNNLKLLAIHLVPWEIPENSYCVEAQQKMIEILKTSEDKSVLVNLNLYINSL